MRRIISVRGSRSFTPVLLSRVRRALPRARLNELLRRMLLLLEICICVTFNTLSAFLLLLL